MTSGTRDLPAAAPLAVTACSACRFRSLTGTASCPLCGHRVEHRLVAPEGTVWSQTLVHLPHGEHASGYRILYVDIDDGPRVLCRQPAADPAASIGDRVLLGQAGRGSFTVTEIHR